MTVYPTINFLPKTSPSPSSNSIHLKFQVEVSKIAIVIELKDAIEAIFTPEKNIVATCLGEILFFLLSHEVSYINGLLRDCGIKDGDQLHFVRHISKVG